MRFSNKMQTGKKVLIIFFIFVFLIWIIDFRSNEPLVQNTESGYQSKDLFLNSEILNVDIADTDEKRALGLSGRDDLSGRGMIFIFEDEEVRGFWMKDMLISIDILWIDSNGVILHIESNVSPDSYPDVFRPNVLAKYVLETDANYMNKKGFKVGDKIENL